jgi:hypothetical protein
MKKKKMQSALRKRVAPSKAVVPCMTFKYLNKHFCMEHECGSVRAFHLSEVSKFTRRVLLSTMPTSLLTGCSASGGNLWRAVRLSHLEYNLTMRPDSCTGACQWFYFLVKNMRADVPYTFNLINFYKDKSLYSEGMRPLLWSQLDYEARNRGWVRAGSHISYSQNGTKRKNGSNYFTLSFQIEFPHDNDSCFLAMCYPYTYTDLRTFLLTLKKKENKSSTFARTELCRTIGNNPCDLLTITTPPFAKGADERKAFVISARVHPGESNASWIVQGLVEYLTGESAVAKLLRNNFVFYVVPMLNPDGVVNGYYRVSLSGHDLNRQWSEPNKHLHPTVFHLKQLVKKLADANKLLMYIDIHGHSVKRNIFMYGCNLGSETQGRVQGFPRLLSQRCPHFSLEACSFDLNKTKENTGRAVVYKEFGTVHSYTVEASFCGYDDQVEGLVHFTAADLQDFGVQLAKTLGEYVVLSDSGWGTSSAALSQAFAAALRADGRVQGSEEGCQQDEVAPAMAALGHQEKHSSSDVAGKGTGRSQETEASRRHDATRQRNSCADSAQRLTAGQEPDGRGVHACNVTINSEGPSESEIFTSHGATRFPDRISSFSQQYGNVIRSQTLESIFFVPGGEASGNSASLLSKQQSKGGTRFWANTKAARKSFAGRSQGLVGGLEGNNVVASRGSVHNLSGAAEASLTLRHRRQSIFSNPKPPDHTETLVSSVQENTGRRHPTLKGSLSDSALMSIKSPANRADLWEPHENQSASKSERPHRSFYLGNGRQRSEGNLALAAQALDATSAQQAQQQHLEGASVAATDHGKPRYEPLRAKPMRSSFRLGKAEEPWRRSDRAQDPSAMSSADDTVLAIRRIPKLDRTYTDLVARPITKGYSDLVEKIQQHMKK